MIANFVPKLLSWLSSPKIFFASFALILTTIGGVFGGDFFKGSWSDFFYIALNHMTGANIYGIQIISADVRYTLSLLPIFMLAYGLLLVTAYTMVGQKNVEKGIGEIGQGLISVASEAAKQVSETKVVYIVDRRGENNQKTDATTHPVGDKKN